MNQVLVFGHLLDHKEDQRAIQSPPGTWLAGFNGDYGADTCQQSDIIYAVQVLMHPKCIPCFGMEFSKLILTMQTTGFEFRLAVP